MLKPQNDNNAFIFFASFSLTTNNARTGSKAAGIWVGTIAMSAERFDTGKKANPKHVLLHYFQLAPIGLPRGNISFTVTIFFTPVYSVLFFPVDCLLRF